MKCLKSYNWFQIFLQQKHAPFYESICSLNELDENQIIQKFQNLEILKKMVQGEGPIF